MADKIENAELLAELDFYDEDHWRNVMCQYPGAQAAIRKAAAAIRALEAKVRALEQNRDEHYVAMPFYNSLEKELNRALDDRDRLAGAAVQSGSYFNAAIIAEQRVAILEDTNARLTAEVEKLREEYDILECNLANDGVLSLRDKNERLTSEVAAMREERDDS